MTSQAIEYPRLVATLRRIPLWVKLVYSAFVAIFVAILAPTSPHSFLWFCNAAVLIILPALWLENRLLISMSALSVFWPHLFWQIDFFTRLAAGVPIFEPFGLTPADYMFDSSFPPWKRFLSMTHVWVLYFLLWLLWRLGYDRRAWFAQSLFAWILLPVSYVLADLQGVTGNLNHVRGISDREPQTWVAPWLWLAFLMVFIPLCHYSPVHFLFRWIFRLPSAVASDYNLETAQLSELP